MQLRDTADCKSALRPRQGGFSLIELLVVIAIMALLASMIFPITRALNRSKVLTRTRAEMAQLETAIEGYKAKVGVYPQSSANTNGTVQNPLYYELLGTTLKGNANNPTFEVLDGSVQISAPGLKSAFGVDGLFNTTRGTSSDEGLSAVNFLRGQGLKPNQIGEYVNPQTSERVRVITCTTPWPETRPGQPIPAKPGLNPWHYNSAAPVHNTTTYDLWVDVIIDGKTNRICNWSRDRLIVNSPNP